MVGDNEPYSGKHPANYTIDHHAKAHGLPHVCIEVRQDLLSSPAGVERWVRLLARIIGEILAEPQPRADLGFSNAIWRYARGVALANKGDINGAKAELAALIPLKANPKVMVLDGNEYPASALLQILRTPSAHL
mgnify:CR=1 FL=1